MSTAQDDLARLIKAVESAHDRADYEEDEGSIRKWLTVFISVVPILIVLATSIYNSGATKQEISDKVDIEVLELKAEMIREISDIEKDVSMLMIENKMLREKLDNLEKHEH